MLSVTEQGTASQSHGHPFTPTAEAVARTLDSAGAGEGVEKSESRAPAGTPRDRPLLFLNVREHSENADTQQLLLRSKSRGFEPWLTSLSQQARKVTLILLSFCG